MFAFDLFYHSLHWTALQCTIFYYGVFNAVSPVLHYLSSVYSAQCSAQCAQCAVCTVRCAWYGGREHSAICTDQNIQCTASYIEKFNLLYTLLTRMHSNDRMYCTVYNCIEHGCTVSAVVGRREESLSLLFPGRAPGQIVMHNKKSLHSNQKVQQFWKWKSSQLYENLAAWKLSRMKTCSVTQSINFNSVFGDDQWLWPVVMVQKCLEIDESKCTFENGLIVAAKTRVFWSRTLVILFN